VTDLVPRFRFTSNEAVCVVAVFPFPYPLSLPCIWLTLPRLSCFLVPTTLALGRRHLLVVPIRFCSVFRPTTILCLLLAFSFQTS